MKTPKTFDELFKFYDEYVKLLYSSVQTTNKLPNETLFEINAAFDHMARKWTFGEDEEYVAKKAYSHLKRSCLDIFKLKYKETWDMFTELQKIDTSIIDAGKFDTNLHLLAFEMKSRAQNARKTEGDKRQDSEMIPAAFDNWVEVYNNAVRLEKDFYQHKDIEWAKTKSYRDKDKFTLTHLLIGIFSSIIGTLIFQFLFL